jgi:hypothetical protein
MPGRSDADADFAGRHGSIYFFLALDLFLVSLFSRLPGLGFFQPFERRWGKQDHNQGDGAKRGNHHHAQIAQRHPKNRAFFLGSIVHGALYRGRGRKAKSPLG